MYFGENRHPTSRRPDPEKEQLAEQNALLRELLRKQHAEAAASKGKPRKWLLAASVLATVIIVASGVAIAFFLAFHNQNAVDTATIAAITGQQINSFTPYYFTKSGAPDGYVADKSQSQYNDGILQVTLTKPGGVSVVLSEQALPGNLLASTLLANTTAVKGAAGPAGVANVEDRIVGTMLPSAHRTLILITGSMNTKQNDISDLLKSLRPI